MTGLVHALALGIGYAVILASLIASVILLGSLACELAYQHIKHQTEFWQAYSRYRKEGDA